MAMAAIDAPHILILDEPTNHLDIESREALVFALNAYEGTVILVSHDSHLVEMVADQLWIVQDGMVAPFNGDMTDYQRQLLARRGVGNTASAREKPSPSGLGDKSHLSGRDRRQNTSKLRARVKSCESTMIKLTTEKEKIVEQMAHPQFYDIGNTEKISQLSADLVNIGAALVLAEKDWLAAEEALYALET